MTEAELRMQAQIVAATAQMYSYVAELEGMKAENETRASGGFSPAYGADEFAPIAQSLRNIATYVVTLHGVRW
jgi:hypothetical protein